MSPVVSPDDRALRLSPRAIVLGGIGVLAAAVLVATLGFTASQAASTPKPAPTVAVTDR